MDVDGSESEGKTKVCMCLLEVNSLLCLIIIQGKPSIHSLILFSFSEWTHALSLYIAA